MLKEKSQGFVSKEKVLAEEYELVHQAIFTDPDDQSGWFYHFWLLDQTITPESPVLVSSWPIHSSDLILSIDGNSNGCMWYPCTSFWSDKGAFPLILYFNQNVKGVNSSTVGVTSTFSKNEDISWQPLSTNKSGYAKAWVTYLKFPNGKDQSLKDYPVEVSVGQSQGIISSTGSNYTFPTQFAFTMSLWNGEGDSGGAGPEKIVWTDNSFHTDEALSEELCSLLSSDRHQIIKDHDSTASKWHIETIVYEIALFRELLLEVNWYG